MEKMLENEETPQYVKQQIKLNLSTLLQKDAELNSAQRKL